MTRMLTRVVAGLLVLVLAGPSVLAATCELTCAIGRHHAMARHHHSAAVSTEAPCHEQQGSNQGPGVQANPSALCHESADLPSAIVDAWLKAVVMSAPPVLAIVIAPAAATRTIACAHERSAPFDSRPTHKPLRV